mmetsp:Transcript_15628/g.33736  ORF Transcript_15628/g.33736 Transcript_15628/m.33736 type:complete len:514 (+) Transcript_15628:115-1656(+)
MERSRSSRLGALVTSFLALFACKTSTCSQSDKERHAPETQSEEVELAVAPAVVTPCEHECSSNSASLDEHSTRVAGQVEAVTEKAVAVVVAAAHVPEWARRPFITHGYRPIGAPLRDIAMSAFNIHNETVNFWSHFIPSVLFGTIALPYVFVVRLAHQPLADRALMAAYVLAATACHSASSAYHLFQCRSERAFSSLCRIDYKGIISLICASQLPALNVLISRKDAVLGAVALFTLVVMWVLGLPLVSMLERRALDGLKNALMITMAAYGAAWALALRALDAAAYYAPGEWAFFANRTLAMYGLYAVGFVVFGLKVPERWMPGKVNVVGHSHQIWHVAVTAACVLWLVALLQFYDFAATQEMAAKAAAAAKAALDSAPAAAAQEVAAAAAAAAKAAFESSPAVVTAHEVAAAAAAAAKAVCESSPAAAAHEVGAAAAAAAKSALQSSPAAAAQEVAAAVAAAARAALESSPAVAALAALERPVSATAAQAAAAASVSAASAVSAVAAASLSEL